MLMRAELSLPSSLLLMTRGTKFRKICTYLKDLKRDFAPLPLTAIYKMLLFRTFNFQKQCFMECISETFGFIFVSICFM